MNRTDAIDAVHAYVDALLDDAAPGAPMRQAVHARISTTPAAPAEPGTAPTPAAIPTPRMAIASPASGPESMNSFAVHACPVPNDPMPAPMLQAQRWVRVAVGTDSYALELLCVQEVVRLAPIVAMRGADPAVLGVMNLRGRIVPVFDLGLWLGAGRVSPDERSRIVVVERGDELIGVLVSAVEDVVTLGRERIEPPPPGADPGHTLGVARIGVVPTVLLDANALYG